MSMRETWVTVKYQVSFDFIAAMFEVINKRTFQIGFFCLFHQHGCCAFAPGCRPLPIFAVTMQLVGSWAGRGLLGTQYKQSVWQLIFLLGFIEAQKDSTDVWKINEDKD